MPLATSRLGKALSDLFLIILCVLIAPTLLEGQSVPNGGTITNGQIWTAAQWNAAWESKTDYPVSASAIGTGTLAAAYGGTGANSLTSHAVVLGNGTGALYPVGSLGTSGQCFVSNGGSSDPSFQSCPGGGSGVSSITGSSGVSASASTGAVTLSLSTIAAGTILGNNTGSSGVPLALTAAQAASILAGTGSGTLAAGNDTRFAGPTQNSQSASYTLVIGDAGGQIYHPSSDTTARTWTIPANSSVAFQVVTKIDLVNECSAGRVTIAITSDTLVYLPSGGTGSRSLAPCGEATLTKVGATRWVIAGAGLS